MNATARAMAYVIDNWQRHEKVISLDAYRAQRWMRRYTRPMGGGDAAA